MTKWLIDGADLAGKRKFDTLTTIGAPALSTELQVFSCMQFMRSCGIRTALIFSETGACACVYDDLVYNFDKDPDEFFEGLPRWPFNEFRKEKL